MAETGDDLRFVDLDGNVLSYEREQGVAWVSIPTLPAEPITLHAYFDNPDAAAPGGDSLWSDYALVVHGDVVEDATGINVASDGLDLPSEPGQIGGALAFDGADDLIVFPPDPSFADLRSDGFTVSCWLWLSSDPGNDNFPRLIDNANLTDATTGWSVMFSSADVPMDRVRVDLGLSSTEVRTVFPAVTTDTWVYVAITVVDEVVTARYDGTTVVGNLTDVGTGTYASDADNPLSIGSSAYDVTRAFLGQVDELRLIRGARDDAWLAAEYQAGLADAVELGGLESAPR